MASKKGISTTFWVVGGIILLAGGIGAYFLFRKPKNGDEDEFGNATDETTTTNETSIPTQLDTKEKVKVFQDWLDKNKPLWLLDSDGKYKNLSKGTASEPNRHISGKGYGVYGKNTANAWKLFGKDFLKTQIPDKLKIFITRGVVAEKDIKDSSFGKYILVNHTSPKNNEFTFNFLENGYFKVLYPSSFQKKYGNVAYEGTFEDGGRSLKISKDNYAFGTDDLTNKTIKSNSLKSNLSKLFLGNENLLSKELPIKKDDKSDFLGLTKELDLNL